VSHQSRFRPELLTDAADAFLWYEARATGLGHEFLRAFYAAVAHVERSPMLSRPVYSDFRRVLLRRFPYKLYYRIEEERVVFYLLFHGARHPGTPRRELRKRDDAS
jgi:hypothetical protein